MSRCAFLGTHREARRESWVCCSVNLHLILLRQDLSLNQELGWQSTNSHDPPVSVLDSTGVIGICMATAGFLCGGWGFELRSSYLCTNHSYALNHFPSPTFFFSNFNCATN